MATLTPVEYDPFSSAGPPPDDSGARTPRLVPVEHDPFAAPAPVGVIEDTAKAVPAGLVKGGAQLAGMPGDIGSLFNQVADFATDYALAGLARITGMDSDTLARVSKETKDAIKTGRSHSAMRGLPTSRDVRSGIEENITGPLYEPQTRVGKVAGKIAEYAPGAVAGGSGVIRNLTNFGVLPGAADEIAGQLTEGSAIEPYARGAAAIATGGAATIVNQPRTVERSLRRAATRGLDDATISNAERLMTDARARGINLTWAEALEQVAPGTGLTNAQRLAESMPEGREILAPVMAQRPQQVEAAARQTFDTLAPPTAAPSSIGPAVGEAATSAVNDVRQRINRVAEPYYDRASTVLLTQEEMNAVRAIPGWREARDAVRNDPQLNRYVANLPDDSVGFLNEVKKYLDNAAEGARPNQLTGQGNMQRSAGYGSDATAVRGAATDATLGNPARNYETALNIERQGREQFLQPLLDGPLGQIAKKDTRTKQAIDALFPPAPLAGSQTEIADAVGRLAAWNPSATRQLVRAHAETTFNESAQALQSGANQYGGAKFAAVIAGNPQQRENLRAAITAANGGDQRVWDGFERFLEIVQATGTRQPIGSRTAFNAQDMKDLSTGSAVAGGVKLAASPIKLAGAVADAWERWQLGNNVGELARILTDPRSAPVLRKVARMSTDNSEAVIAAGRLITNATGEGRSGSAKDAR
jgi:hypothetical protein